METMETNGYQRESKKCASIGLERNKNLFAAGPK